MRSRPRRLTLRERVLAAFVGVVAIVLVVNIVSAHIVGSAASEQLDIELAGEAQSIVNQISPTTSPTQASVYLATRVDPTSIVEVRLSSGFVLHTGSTMGWAALRSSTSTNAVSWSHMGWRFYTLRTSNGRQVTVGTGLDAATTSMNGVRLEQLLATLVTLAVLLILSIWVVSIGVTPISRIAQVARRISEGNSAERIEVPESMAGTEYADVAEAINNMVTGLEDMVSNQREVNEELRRFVADAGHELRTPLTSVSGYAQLLESGQLDEVTAREALGRIRSEAGRMSRVVEDLMSLARLEEIGGLRYEHFDLVELVHNLVGDHATIDASYQHPVTVTGDKVVMLDGDVDKISQVIINLLGNLRSHTPEGTTATLNIARRGPRVVLEYADDGPGVSDPGRIFTRFWQADPGRRGAGSGLGMAIVEAAVKAHKGQVRATSNKPTGLRIRIDIPDEAA